MKIIIAGGSGFLGKPLVKALLSKHEVAVLTRDASRVREGRAVVWNPAEQGAWKEEVSAADVVINLAGESIAEGRWTDERKKQLVSSRLDTTRSLVAVLRTNPRPDRTFISASAIGYYGSRGDEVLTEASSAGDGFLPDLSLKWENEASAVGDAARLVIIRIGVILAPDGGALGKILPIFRMMAGGRLGHGGQYWSWIDRDDLIGMMAWAIENRNVSGIFNGTAPNPVTNAEFTRILSEVLKRPAIFPAPEFAVRAAFGEMADAFLGSQRVIPARAIEGKFSFQYEDLKSSLKHQIG